MGVKNLWDVLESCKKTLPLNHLQNKRVCIDLSTWIVQLQNVNKSHCAQIDKLSLRGLFHRLRALIALNCTIILVADGSIPAIKLSTYRRRLNLGSEVTEDETNSDKVSSLRRNTGSEFSIRIKEAKALGLALGVPCLDGIEEAEAQCALLNLESLCDGCFSSDSDIFLFGARTVYRDICLGEGGYVVCYEMDDIERKLGFGRNSLISLALFLGSDYSQGVHGLGPESACQIVKSIGDDVVLQRIASEGLSFVKKTKNSKKAGQLHKGDNKAKAVNQEIYTNGNDHCSQRYNPFLQVIDAYLKPKCHSAESDAVHRVLVQHLFQRAKLQQICAQFFEWPPEKTDEYILPKIAERDLRRFANLRSTSSALGVNLPLQKMPVKCPVTEIIKRRKVQGRECFEVSWEELDGLKTSVVPADLIESACPQKILEFEEKRALPRRSKKSKPKSSKTKSPVTEIDQKLQALLLLDIEEPESSNTIHNASFSSRTTILENRTAATEIDQELQALLLLDIEESESSSTIHNASFSSRTTVLENRTAASEVNFTRRDYPLREAESESSSDGNATVPFHPTGPTVVKNEVIDLISPSPVVRCKNVSRSQKMNNQHVNVIDLSDSESERSPEHERKAKELRLFLASIRDEIP